MSWPKTGITNYHAKLGLPDKGRAIKRIGCLLYCIVKVYEGYGSCDFGKERRSGSMLWLRWPSSSSNATPHRM